MPGVPYNLVNYAAGLTTIRLAVFAGATALGAAPRAFAYTALGGSLDDLGSPEAIVAVVVLVVMAAGGLVRAQTVWICSRLVVPGFPDGRPAVMPTRSPGLTQPSSTTRRALARDQLLGDLDPRIEAAWTPHMSPQRRTVSRPGESA